MGLLGGARTGGCAAPAGAARLGPPDPRRPPARGDRRARGDRPGHARRSGARRAAVRHPRAHPGTSRRRTHRHRPVRRHHRRIHHPVQIARPAPPAAWTPTPPRPYAAVCSRRALAALCDTDALAPAHPLARRRPPAPSHPRPAPTISCPPPPTPPTTRPTRTHHRPRRASGRGPPGVEADHRARRRTPSACTDRAAGAGRPGPGRAVRRRRPGDDGAHQVRVPSPHDGRSVRM